MTQDHIADLIAAVMTFEAGEDEVRNRLRDIGTRLLATSKYVRQPDFCVIHTDDLAFLFDACDEEFLRGRCRKALDGRTLSFRLARRLTVAGGKTTRFRSVTGEVSFEIAVATSILFDGFDGDDRTVSACGLPCQTRLEALQRIVEHEFVHLVEQLCWGRSKCSEARFQDIARRLFGHCGHTHSLITRRERAAISGIRVGSLVTFEFEGRRLAGRVNRITKRATVLVEDPAGTKFSDGGRYRTYYVPLKCLQLVAAAGA